MNIWRIPYYIFSLFSLLRAMEGQWRIAFLWSLFFSSQRTVYLRRPFPLIFATKTLLDALILTEVIIDREYESRGVMLDGDDRIIVDIGAGFGDFAIGAAKRFPQASIIAVEIDPVYLSLLKRNIRANQVSNIRVVQTSMKSISDIFKLVKSGTSIDFLKIDCEGCEYPLFDHVTKNELRRIKKISMEYHEFGGKKKEVIVQPLQQAGFHLVVQPIGETPGTGHIVATQKEKGKRTS